MATVARTHMTVEEAQSALAQVEAQITSHSDTCGQCRAARYGQVSRIWKSCPAGLELFRTEMALTHRLAYLAMKERRRR